MKPRLFATSMLALALGCGPDTANEARLFLDRYEGLDFDVDDLDERGRRIETLRRLAIASEEVSAARDVCVSMHEALLEAEVQQAAARAFVTRLEAGRGGQDDAAAAERAIARSAEATGRVRDRRPACDEALATLRGRY